jgi:hypothetical protein
VQLVVSRQEQQLLLTRLGVAGAVVAVDAKEDIVAAIAVEIRHDGAMVSYARGECALEDV